MSSAQEEKVNDSFEKSGSPIKPVGHLRQAAPSTTPSFRAPSVSDYEDIDPEILRKFREFIDNG